MANANVKLEIPNICLCGKGCTCKKCRMRHFDLEISNFMEENLDEK